MQKSLFDVNAPGRFVSQPAALEVVDAGSIRGASGPQLPSLPFCLFVWSTIHFV
ncbi:MAG: hypothetical protein IK144_05610 [Bacteroidaceae bacterium]|nr:hypothetical protein [Bacteroidaceae bacterium]